MTKEYRSEKSFKNWILNGSLNFIECDNFKRAGRRYEEEHISRFFYNKHFSVYSTLCFIRYLLSPEKEIFCRPDRVPLRFSRRRTYRPCSSNFVQRVGEIFWC